MLRILSTVLAFVAVGTLPAQSYTPTQFQITLYDVEISTDGTSWTTLVDNEAGLSVDLADPNAFSNAFAPEVTVQAGTYEWIRMTIGEDLVWSYPSPPINLSNQTFTVTGGPPGPVAGQQVGPHPGDLFAQAGRANVLGQTMKIDL